MYRDLDDKKWAQMPCTESQMVRRELYCHKTKACTKSQMARSGLNCFETKACTESQMVKSGHNFYGTRACIDSKKWAKLPWHKKMQSQMWAQLPKPIHAQNLRW